MVIMISKNSVIITINDRLKIKICAFHLSNFCILLLAETRGLTQECAQCGNEQLLKQCDYLFRVLKKNFQRFSFGL